jgi:pantoate--beta-alanine ligase
MKGIGMSFLCYDVHEFKIFRNQYNNDSFAFIPTMGALHAGHLSLIDEARKHAKKIVVSIFVNPMQFNDKSDFTNYPRTLENDLKILAPYQVDAVFCPSPAAMYPEGFQTHVENIELSQILCGAQRPGHFKGVCTVVLKLLNIIRPQVMLLGKKDYQQYKMLKKMLHDLNLDTKVIPGPIVREDNGLALSSRNLRLNLEERNRASSLAKGLFQAKKLFVSGVREKQDLLQAVSAEIDPSLAIDYLELLTENLQETSELLSTNEKYVLLAAIKVGPVRLIDNIELESIKL